MTSRPYPSRKAAEAACAELAETHADRTTHRFLPRRRDGGWEVVKVALPPPAGEHGTETRADERPSTPDDPRSAHHRNIGPYTGI